MADQDVTQRRRRTRRERGQAIVEFGLVSLAFFFLVFGIIDFARLFQSWVTVQHAAREGARYAVTGQVSCSGYSDNRPACITQKAKNATAGLYGGGGSGTAVTVSTKHWDYPSYGGSGTSGPGSQCDAVEVSVSYTHGFVLPVLKIVAPVGVTVVGKQRMVNEPFGPCS